MKVEATKTKNVVVEAKDRALDRVEDVIESYEFDADDTFVTDVLTDMMYFCDENGIDFDYLLDVARHHHEVEGG